MLRFLLDEHLRRHVWFACRRQNIETAFPIDVLRVGDADSVPLGTPDPEILIWAEAHGRILVTRDLSTMPTHFGDHLAAGQSSPGVFVLTPTCSNAAAVEFMACAAYASEAFEWRDRLVYVEERSRTS